MSDYSSGYSLNIPGPGLSELVGANAVPLRSALAAAQLGTGLCNIVFLGNSVTQRFLASATERGYAERTMALIASALGITDPPGYYPASTNTNYTGMTYTPSGTFSLVEDSGFCGEAYYWQLATTLTSPTINPSTGIWIHCQKGPAIGGSFTYQVNGGAVQGPVNPGGAPRTGGRIWDHGNAGGLVAGGANQIVFTSNVTFGSVVEGVTFFNGNHNTTRPQGFITQANANTGVGLRHWICGHSGFFSTRYATPGFGSGSSAAQFTDPMEFINPHCVVIELGINDINQGLSVQTFMANIQTMVSMIRARAVASTFAMPTLIFLACYGTSLDPLDQYIPMANALKNYCYGNGFGLLDLSALLGDVVGVTSVSSDNIHPNDSGHYVIANYLSKMMLDS